MPQKKKTAFRSFLELAKERSTSYLYADKPVSESAVQKILEAGRWAPNCSNSQPWKFIVIENKELITKLIKTIQFGRPPQPPPVMIAIIFEKSLAEQAPICKVTDESGYSEGIMSVAMAALQMALQATEIGLASALLSPRKDASPLLNLTGDEEPLFLLTLGFAPPNAPKKPRIRRDIKEIVQQLK